MVHLSADMTSPQLPFGAGTKKSAPLTVSDLVARIKESILDTFPKRLSVIGQISNLKRHSSGHLYFSLKDASAAIDAVMFRSAASAVRFDVEDGLEVVASGRIDVYERQGRLQFYVERLTPRGTGALELAFRQLTERLEREGLFDPARKKPLVRFPRAVGVITSPTGAAVRDIARTLSRRWPAAKVFLAPVSVQGDQAADQIAEAVRLMDSAAEKFQIDTIIVARGGGSLEDLWAFNEEILARAIFAAETPIISGVGHEVDFTIADFVSDVRAATPTAAAELAVPDGTEIRRHCETLVVRLARKVRDLLQNARNSLASAQRSAVFRDPSGLIRADQQMLDDLTSRLRRGLQDNRIGSERRFTKTGRDLAWALGRRAKKASDDVASLANRLAAVHPRHRLVLAKQQLTSLARQMEAMSYKAVVKRGYSVTRIAGKQILRSVCEVTPGEMLETEVSDGKIISQVSGEKTASKKPNIRREITPNLFEELEK
ncbi:MAG: exodeoxyribonuclease VII large subunit [Planctomycetota bacterium]|nr:exodeoxyribonuclease VII large subunit [Planctomycetota bacterium]